MNNEKVIKEFIKSIKSFIAERSIHSLLDTLYQLKFNTIIEKKDIELWSELRTVLYENEFLRDQDSTSFFTIKS